MISHRHPSRTVVRLFATACVLALPFTLAACGSDDSGGGGDAAPEGDFTLTADNIAWSTNSIDAPAGADFVIVIDNKDDGVQHNLDIKETDLKTELAPGPVFQTLTVNLEAGDYNYACDLHPAMTGTLHVS